MIGPKQFDIGHKVKPRRELINPIVNRLFEPKFKYREDDLKDIMESFVDKFKAPLFEFEEHKIKPLSKSKEFLVGKHESKLDSLAGSFLDRFNLPKMTKPRNIKTKESDEENNEKEEMSEEMINKITYKVFQNIREYLKDEGIFSEQKSIKLEINL